jgi:pimeloyl-ACP methyl ester carboxylesterase
MTGSFVHHDTGMATKKRKPGDTYARLRRMYIDGRYGQLHVATAYPASGGFDEALPLVCLHADDGSGADFSRCAELLGTDRSIYAPDLPGSGNSDAPKARLPVAGLALAVVDLIEQLRLKRVDLFGCGRGALVAFELASTLPARVRRVIVAGSQQPAATLAQPMLQLSADPNCVLEGPAEAVVGQVRAFLDRR